MEIRDKRIDGGTAFDWGRTSEEYARYRDIYPDEFYKKIAERGLCINGQKVLDLQRNIVDTLSGIFGKEFAHTHIGERVANNGIDHKDQGELDQHGQAAAHGVIALSLIELLQLRIVFLLVIAVFLFQGILKRTQAHHLQRIFLLLHR